MKMIGKNVKDRASRLEQVFGLQDSIADRHRKRPLANGPGTKKQCVGRSFSKECTEHRNVAAIASGIVPFGSPAHRRISRFIHEFGCGDPSESIPLPVAETVARKRRKIPRP